MLTFPCGERRNGQPLLTRRSSGMTGVVSVGQWRLIGFVYTLAPSGESPSPTGGKAVADTPRASRSSTLPSALCVVILLGMAATVAYIAWIAVLNFSRIGV